MARVSMRLVYSENRLIFHILSNNDKSSLTKPAGQRYLIEERVEDGFQLDCFGIFGIFSVTSHPNPYLTLSLTNYLLREEKLSHPFIKCKTDIKCTIHHHNSTARSTKVLSACCQPVIEGHS